MVEPFGKVVALLFDCDDNDLSVTSGKVRCGNSSDSLKNEGFNQAMACSVMKQ